MNLIAIVLLFFSIFFVFSPKAYARGGYHHMLKFIDCKEITDIRNEIDQDKKIIRADRVSLQKAKKSKDQGDIKKQRTIFNQDIQKYRVDERSLDKCITVTY